MLHFAQLSAPMLSTSADFKITGNGKMLLPVKQIVLNEAMITCLKCSYSLLYPGIIFDGVFQRFAKESWRASFLNEVYGSKLMSRENNIVIMAYWPSSSTIFPTVNSNLPQSVGEIQFFLQHHLGVKSDHLFACVYWYQKHTNYYCLPPCIRK